jgi:hypothetical protein
MFVGGVVAALNQENKKLGFQMLISIVLVSLLLAVASVFIVDKYTKSVKLYKVKNKRLLSTEKIIYTGIVKNEGKFTIGEVVVEIKLVNKGHATGNVKGGNFFKPSGFADFFSGTGTLYKPQSITKEFIVAKNLKPGRAKSFRVYFDYPPYFRSVADFTKVSGH